MNSKQRRQIRRILANRIPVGCMVNVMLPGVSKATQAKIVSLPHAIGHRNIGAMGAIVQYRNNQKGYRQVKHLSPV